MLKRLIYIFLAGSLISVPANGAEAVNFLISIHQIKKETGEKVPVYSGNTIVRKGISSSAFLTGISLDIELLSVDSQHIEFNVHTVTLGARGRTQAKQFTSEFGLPAVVSDIEVKGGSFYSLTLTPDSFLNLNDGDCNYDHNNSDAFTSFPSANFDLQFLKSSLANFHAASLKMLFEAEYRSFREKFHFNMTSKPLIYCFPCPVNSVIWDFRFGTAIDPTRNNCYTLYHSGVNTADPFVLIHEAILRSYGYAPQFLTDGWAGYMTMALHRMKKYISKNANLPLSELIETKNYLSADPQIAEASAATFVRYLIDRYTITSFRELYESADDVNLREQIEINYGKDLRTLESEWLNYIDTVNIPAFAYKNYARRAEQMFDYPLMLEYSNIYAERAGDHLDSVESLSQLARAYYFNGDYYGAVKSQKKLNEIEPDNWRYKFGLATFRMMNGEYEKAYDDLVAAQSPEINDVIIRFNLALNWLERGDSAQARNLLLELVNSEDNAQVSGEARTLLGYLLRNDKNGEIKLQATDHFTIAIGSFNQQIQANPAIPSPYMWSGIALLGMNDAESAYQQLQQAKFLESRPFYLGMINLWLGKTSDVRNKREAAKQYYSEVLSNESAVYHQEEARLYLNKPYNQ